jgi:hypothetical protein
LDETRKGLYKGVGVTLFSSVLRGTITLPVYDLLKSRKVEESSGYLSTFWDRLGPSFMSSLIISVILYPFDTVKRCLQLNGGRGQMSLYRGAPDAFSKIFANYGFSAFYRGVHIFAIKELIQAFAYISVY